MGIKDLLKELKPIMKTDAHLSHFRGKRAGVDASCWLHRSAHSCAWELVSGKGSDKYLKFLLKCIDCLQRNGVIPIIVFDGAQLPMKANEEHRRGVDRDNALREAMEADRMRDWQRRHQAAQRAVRTTKEMLKGFIDLCVENAVKFVCSPYEADAQLGYMYKHNQIDFVISEDSDLILYGVREVFYKLDVNGGGNGHYLNLDEIRNYRPPRDVKKSAKSMDLCLFLKRYPDLLEMIHVCVLSGCDYLNSLPGIGLKTAVKKSNAIRKVDRRVSTLLSEIAKKKSKKKKDAPKDYRIQFKRAVLTFLHQRVYDIHSKQLTFLNPLTDAVDAYLHELKRYLARQPTVSNAESKNPTVYDTTLNFLGKEVDHETARLVAEGRLDARSLKPRNITGMVGYRPSGAPSEDPSSRGDDGSTHDTANSKIYATHTHETSRLGLGPFSAANSTQLSPSNELRARPNSKPKSNKYFGRLESEGNERVVQLDDLMAAFGHKADQKEAEDTPFEDVVFEDTASSSKAVRCDAVRVPISDDEDAEEERMEEHRPLKRKKNRKRKRDEMAADPDIPSIEDVSPCPSKRASRRRRLNGSSPLRSRSNPNTTPKSKFITKTTPKNMQSEGSSSRLNNSIVDDLFFHAVDSLDRQHGGGESEEEGERVIPKRSRKNKHNPFSLKREESEPSLALIGAANQPTSSHSEQSEDSGDDEEGESKANAVSKSYEFLSYKKEVEGTRKADGVKEEYGGARSQEKSADEEEQKGYCRSMSSQSTNDLMMMDQMERLKFQLESKRNAESEEDDDIQILPVQKEKSGTTAVVKVKKKRARFNPPRNKDGTTNKLYGAKKKGKASSKKNSKTKTEGKQQSGKGQSTLFSMWGNKK